MNQPEEALDEAVGVRRDIWASFDRAFKRVTNSIRQQRWQWLIALILGVVIYSYLASRLWFDWQALNLRSFRLRYDLLALSLVPQGVGTLLAIWTWSQLMRQMGYPIPFRRHLKVYTATNVARAIPGFVWWLLGRAYLYDRSGVSKLDTSAGALLEIAITATGALFLSVATTLLFPTILQSINPIILVALLCMCLVLLHPRLFEKARQRIGVSATVSRIPVRQLMMLLVCQTVVVMLGGVCLYYMLAAIYPVPPYALPSAIQAWALSIVSGSLLFWLPFDFGFTSGLLAMALATMMPMPVALVSVIAWRSWGTVCVLIWGVLGIAFGARPVTYQRQSHIHIHDT